MHDTCSAEVWDTTETEQRNESVGLTYNGSVRALFVVVGLISSGVFAAEPNDVLLTEISKEGAQSPLGRDLLAASGQSLGVAQALTQTTELAISPLLALTAMSGWRWWHTEASLRGQLPFYAQPWFWGSAVVVLLLILFKEVVIARIPGAKKPLDALQLLENKVSGLLASPLAIGALAWALQRAMQGLSAQQVSSLVVGTAWAGTGDVASTPLPAALTWVFALVGATVVYGSVWLASHTINVLILLSPFGLVDNALKLMRFGLLVTVSLLSKWFPTLGAVVCGGLVVLAVLSAGFSYRLMRFGWSFVVGLLRSPADVGGEGRVFVYSGPALALPVRTNGWLALREGQLVFRYRRAFVLPRELVVTRVLRVERGVLHPVLLDEKGVLAFRLTPRARGLEDEVSRVLGGLKVEDAPMVRGLKGLGAWLRGALSGDFGADLDVR